MIEKSDVAVLMSTRHENALRYALGVIKTSELCQYTKALYVYGRCARHEETYDDDLELMLVLAEEVEHMPHYYSQICKLMNDVTDPTLFCVKTDLEVVTDDDWNRIESDHFNNIRSEGIEVWNTNNK